MACSDRQRESARINGARSNGPSDRGKEISRRNSLKHGLTGEGIVLTTQDSEECDRRLAEFEAALRPTNAVETELVKRICLMSTRLRRSAQHEEAVLQWLMDRAIPDHDEAILADVDYLVSWIAKEPATHSRLLKTKNPTGLRRLITEIDALRSDIVHPGGCRWTLSHCDRLLNLLGLRFCDVPMHRIRALSEGMDGNFKYLGQEDGGELDRDGREDWCMRRLVELIDGELAALKELLEGFDHAALERERASAPARAMFDSSKEGILARKYEAASERSLLRALKELRELRKAEAQTVTQEEVVPEAAEESGSFFPEPPGDPDSEADDDPTPAIGPDPAHRRRPDLKKLARKGRRRDHQR